MAQWIAEAVFAAIFAGGMAWTAVKGESRKMKRAVGAKVDELAGGQPHDDEDTPERASAVQTGLIGMAVRKELLPVVEAQKAHAKAQRALAVKVAAQGEMIELLVHDAKISATHRGEHSARITAVEAEASTAAGSL